jgi:hypothetical protein
LFAQQNRLKLVTQCSNRSDSAQHLELEYLSYRLYAAIAEVAFRVRPVRMRYVDTERNGRETSAPAFLLEHEDGVAARHGMAALAVPQVTSEALDVEAGATLALLQFLLGNTDWSVLGAADNENCCHNSAILGPVGIETDALPDATIVPVPYDFDQAGFINTTYALPSERLRIRRVTQRLYRGLCAQNSAVPQVAARIVEARPTIEALLTTSQRLDSAYRDRALEFLRGGFEILGNPKLLASEVLDDCRGEAGGDA